jgi:hypothetical protein
MSTKIKTALLAAQADICAKGIAKLNRADLGGAKVNFRGIEQAMNEMSPILVRHGITVTSRYSDLNIMERTKAEGKATRFVTLKGSFEFSADDDSKVIAECYGEAMDNGDKAVTKAQSVAFRTALFQQFVVPTMAMDTEIDDDAGEDELLDVFRAAAFAGTAALQEEFKTRKPAESFWKKHSASLKDAAAKADAGAVAS